jgi:hypothetical protein
MAARFAAINRRIRISKNPFGVGGGRSIKDFQRDKAHDKVTLPPKGNVSALRIINRDWRASGCVMYPQPLL